MSVRWWNYSGVTLFSSSQQIRAYLWTQSAPTTSSAARSTYIYKNARAVYFPPYGANFKTPHIRINKLTHHTAFVSRINNKIKRSRACVSKRSQPAQWNKCIASVCWGAAKTLSGCTFAISACVCTRPAGGESLIRNDFHSPDPQSRHVEFAARASRGPISGNKSSSLPCTNSPHSHNNRTWLLLRGPRERRRSYMSRAHS